MSRDFYIYNGKHGKFQAEFLDPNTGLRVCFRTIDAKSFNEAVLKATKMVIEGIPDRKRGRNPVYKKPIIQSKEAVIGLAAILKAIKNSPDLDQAGAMEIVRTLIMKMHRNIYG